MAVLILGAASLTSVFAEERSTPFSAEPVGEGVWLMTPDSYGGGYTNSLLVEREDGLLVVNAQPTTAAAEELLVAIALVRPAPVRFLVLPHPHVECMGGESAFPDSTLRITSKDSAEALADETFDYEAEMREPTAKPTSPAAPSRPRPTLIIGGATRLDDPRNAVELLPTAPAHSPGQLLIRLLNVDLFYLGALLDGERNPYVDVSSSIDGWLGVLNGVARQRPGKLVPLRGEIADATWLRARRDAFAWVRGQIEMGFVDQVPTGEMTEWLLANPELTHHFDTEASPGFLPSFLDKAIQEAIDKRGRGFRYGQE